MRNADSSSPSPELLTATAPAARIVEFFERLEASTMGLVDDFYAADCHFVDPLGELHGTKALRDYYQRLYDDVDEIAFEFGDVIGDSGGANGVEPSWFAAPWTMRLRAKLGGGKLIEVPGISRIRFGPDGKAQFHQDYFDLGAFVYENVPVLRRLVGYVKKRLSGH